MPLRPACWAAGVAVAAVVGWAREVVVPADEHFAGKADGVFDVSEEGEGAGTFVVVGRGCHYLDGWVKKGYMK